MPHLFIWTGLKLSRIQPSRPGLAIRLKSTPSLPVFGLLAGMLRYRMSSESPPIA